MLKIGICDDSKIFLICAEKLIRKWSDERRIPIKIYTFNNGDKLVAANTEERLDIIFLDIIMPLLNGMDAARELRQRDKSVKIIFLTSSPEFALESYEVKAQGYVLKPIAYDKLKELLDECAQSFAEEPKNMVIKTVTGYQKLYFHEIEYAEAQNKRVFFHLRSGRQYHRVCRTISFLRGAFLFAGWFFQMSSELPCVSAKCRSFYRS